MLDKIKSWFNGNGNFFHDKVTSLDYMNTSNNDFEQTKAFSAKEVNKNIASLNVNNDVVSSIRLAYEKGVIGTKISIQSRTENQEFNKEFEKYIRIWSKRGNCEVTGRYYRGLAERSLVGYNKIQGGFILRHHINPKWKIPYKFEIIPLSMIDNTKDNIVENKINGIEITNYGEVKGIHIYDNSDRTTSSLVSYKNLTLFVIPFVDSTQYSGLSPLAPILATLDMLTNYNMAELNSAKNQAEGAIIVKTNLFNEILRIKQENARKSVNGKVSETELFDLYKHFKINGSLDGANYIPKDDDVVNIQANSNSIFESLDSSGKRTISAGSGLSTQTTIREMPSSYNSALLNAQLDNAQFEIDFEDFTELAWREVVEERLLNALVLKGLIKADDYWENQEDYRQIEFIRKSTSHIDPSKVEKSISEGLENGTLNPIDEISKKGIDWESNLDKRILHAKRVKEKIQEAGLNPQDLGLENYDLKEGNINEN